MGVHHIAAQRGTITRATRTEQRPMSGLTPDQAVTALREGLETYLATTGGYHDLATQMDAERDRVRALRRAIADRIEADIAILDALAPDADLEDGHDFEDVSLPIRGSTA